MLFRIALVAGLASCATAEPSIANDGNNAINDAQRLTGTDGRTATGDGPIGSGCTFSGVLATWDFTSQTGSEASVVSASAATGVTAGPVTRATALTSSSGAGSINSTNWPTGGAIDATKYYAFTISPPSGCALKITTIDLDAKASASGPATGMIATSSDSFVMTTSASTAAPSTPALNVSSSASLEVRVFGYSASSTGGTFRVENTLTVNGTIQ
jgi:hypothetical protein